MISLSKPDVLAIGTLNEQGIMRIPKEVVEALKLKGLDKVAFVKNAQGHIEIRRAKITIV